MSWTTALLLTLGIIVSSEALLEPEVKTISQCYHNLSMVLSCPSDALIRVHNVTYGRSNSNICSYEEGDCHIVKPVSFGCNGKVRCDVSQLAKNLLSPTSPLPKCGVTANYFNVKYECVKVTSIADMCRDKESSAKSTSGYVAVPSLADGAYTPFLNCQYKIIGYDIRLFLITVNLTDTHDCFELTSPLRTKTYCGEKNVVIENHQLSSLDPDSVTTLKFRSGADGHAGAVWIYYEKTPGEPDPTTTTTIPPTTPPSTPPPTTQTAVETSPNRQINSWTVTVDEKDTSTHASPLLSDDKSNQSKAGSSSTIAIVVGLVLGLTFLLLIALFGLYFMKWRKDRRRKRAKYGSPSIAGEHVAWHNITNECLTDIISKVETSNAQAYSNNVMVKDDNSNQCSKEAYVEHSYC